MNQEHSENRAVKGKSLTLREQGCEKEKPNTQRTGERKRKT